MTLLTVPPTRPGRFAPTDGRLDRVPVVRRLATPLGPMVAAAVDDGVVLLEFADRRMLPRQLRRIGAPSEAVVDDRSNLHLDRLAVELAEYFSGRRQAFDVPILAPGADFQVAAWTWLRTIPFGETRTYAEGAAALGRPAAVRAFGRANGDNRLAVVIPCHRVVGSDGRLTGYGGGLWRKRALLELEGALG